MTTIRELVSSSFREGNVTQVGDTPDGAEYLEAEKRLLSFITSIFGAELGENPINVNYKYLDQTLPKNMRLVFSAESPSTVALTEEPQDGQRILFVDPSNLLSVANTFTITSSPSPIEGEDSVVLNAAGTTKHWFYRADLGQWKEVTSLTSDSESPFPTEFDDLFIAWLAMRLAPRQGVELQQSLGDVYQRMLKLFRARYSQIDETEVEAALLRLTSSTYSAWTNWSIGR